MKNCFFEGLDFCIWDHYNPNFVKEDGFTEVKLRFFISNENYFYVYQTENFKELPLNETPEFVCRVENLRYQILKNEDFLLIKVKVGFYDQKRHVRKHYQFISKEVKDKCELIKVLKLYGKREEMH